MTVQNIHHLQINLAGLPPEMIMSVFEFCDAATLARISSISKNFRDITQNYFAPFIELAGLRDLKISEFSDSRLYRITFAIFIAKLQVNPSVNRSIPLHAQASALIRIATPLQMKIACPQQAINLKNFLELSETTELNYMDGNQGIVLSDLSSAGYSEMILFLLANSSISKTDREVAIVDAISSNNFEIVPLILEKAPFEDQVLLGSVAVSSALAQGNFEIAALIRPNGHISDFERGQAVVQAIEERNFELVPTLLANGPINSQYRAIIAAINKENFQIVSLFANHLTERQRGLAIINASSKRNPEMVSLLLRHGNISFKHRFKAIENAASKGGSAIASLLKKDYSWFNSCLHFLVKACLFLQKIFNLPLLRPWAHSWEHPEI